MPDPDLEDLAVEIQEGRDDIAVPEDLLSEEIQTPPPARPVTKSLLAQVREMTVGQRLKLALKGNRDARTLLLRDSSRLVQRFVLQNPRVTEEEIIAVAKNRNAERELLTDIVRRKEWVANYQIRLALVTNPKTPLAISLRFVSALSVRDLRQLAKSKNVPTAVCSMAKRLVLDRGGK